MMSLYREEIDSVFDCVTNIHEYTKQDNVTLTRSH